MRLVLLSCLLVACAPAEFSQDADRGASAARDAFIEGMDITDPDPLLGNAFGSQVSMGGDVLLVADWNYNYQPDPYVPTAGAAWIFHRDQGGPGAWGMVVDLGQNRGGGLIPANSLNAVATDGTHAIIQIAGNPGGADIFRRDQGGPDNWDRVATVTDSGGPAPGGFANLLEIDGSTAAAVRPSGGPDRGVWVFERDAGGPDAWGEVMQTTMNADANQVDLDVDTLVVSSVADGQAGPYYGAVYVYERNHPTPGAWGLATTILGDGTVVDLQSGFGNDVAISGDTLMVTGLNWLFVHERDAGGPGNWGEVARHNRISDNSSGDLSGDRIVFGDGPAANGWKDAWLFERDTDGPGQWGESDNMAIYNPSSVSLDGDTLAFGPGTPNEVTLYAFGVDADADGYASIAAGGDDCDDSNAAINPAAPETCNGVDDNCDGSVDELQTDLDTDGWPWCTDCDDSDAGVNPGAIEVPGNGVDEDCDGIDGFLSITAPVPGTAGVQNTLTATGATAFETVSFIYATSPGSTPVPGCPGVTMPVGNPQFLGNVVADVSGVAVFQAVVPAQAAGLGVGFGAVELNTCRKSNTVPHVF